MRAACQHLNGNPDEATYHRAMSGRSFDWTARAIALIPWIEQLSAASGKLMQFFTALAVVRQTQGSQCVFEQCQVVETQVRFRTLSAAQIQHYVDREPAFDCAGAAKCEGLGISLMASIQSEDPTALIGLPLIRLTHMLLDAGYDLLSADSAAQRP
ncbi:MAG: hypothetical protein EBW39_04720 [Betaproteobacteria bacterium]|nr:hypothetical protein [Betaproteobacteria bacterium]